MTLSLVFFHADLAQFNEKTIFSFLMKNTSDEMAAAVEDREGHQQENICYYSHTGFCFVYISQTLKETWLKMLILDIKNKITQNNNVAAVWKC